MIEPSNGGANVTTTYGYDVGNRLASATTTSGVTQTRSWTYDRRGLLLCEQAPELGANGVGKGFTQYSAFDARGHATRKKSLTQAQGCGSTASGAPDLTYQFDRAERLTLVRETGGTARPLKQFAYEATGGSGLGKLESADRHNYVSLGTQPYDGLIRETYTYDGRGGRVSNRRTELFVSPGTTPNPGTSPNEIWDVGFEYTPLGEIDLVDYPVCSLGFCPGAGPGTERIVVNLFARGWLQTVESDTGQDWATIGYHSNGMVSQVSHRNGVATVYGLDGSSMQRPSSIGTTGVAAGQNWTTGLFQFDGSGNVVKIGNSIFLYDKVNRIQSAELQFAPSFQLREPFPDASFFGLDLIFADGFESGTTSAWTVPTTPTEGMQTFTYDAFGNLTNIAGDPGRAIPTDAGTNRLSGAGNVYDVAGNLTSWARPEGGTNSYSYGPFNETWRVVTSNQEWVHVYSADDERIFSYQTTGGEKTRWTLRGLDNRVLRDYLIDRTTGTGTIERDNIYRGSGPLLAAATPSGDRHFHVDHLGSPRQITDAAKNQIAFHTYWPYGEEATLPNQNTLRYKFTGHERDLADPNTPNDDHDHMHARVTNPQIGRFLSVDPVGGDPRRPQGWNRYGYVRGSPLTYTDPTGEIGPLFVAELVATAVDAYETYRTVKDPDKSAAEKIVTASVAVAGIFSPGGGATVATGFIGRIVKNAENAVDAVDKALDGARGSTTVTGKLDDLKSLTPDEQTLLNRLPNQGSPRANWYQNSSVLREEMSLGRPIRDASVDSAGRLINNTGFLRAERNLLETRGWTYDQATRMWHPPAGP